jgi:2-oxoglutarate ferredoxin oxidoreductase subunit gamma
METSFIISGFGGQGTLFAGQVLAYSALDNQLQVTWIPSYGPEMRGGTASCTVVIADHEIGSPLVNRPDVAIVMNLPSLDKYEPRMRPGGVLIANSSLINRELARPDLNSVFLPANEIAEKIGNARLANMVMLGGMLELVPVLTLEQVKQGLSEHIPERHKNTLPLNYEAMEMGATLAKEYKVLV